MIEAWAEEAGTASQEPGSLRERIFRALRGGATIPAAAAIAGTSVALVEVMCDEFMRLGMLQPAQSLCSSGLGACGGGDSAEVKVHCAGCPLTLSRKVK